MTSKALPPLSIVAAYDHARSKSYLSDGAYVEFDGFYIMLTTENGIETTNRIGLDEDGWVALRTYVDTLRKAAERLGAAQRHADALNKT